MYLNPDLKCMSNIRKYIDYYRWKIQIPKFGAIASGFIQKFMLKTVNGIY